ncbi:hypothetical protein FJT64_003116 [Amphibalanus amphitrite]|uniref:Transposase Helix-turn-helix domain-containing protein n=1 Tax=Amphibalanus amphitrite TaxID=1232801 RepID=A0A6A4W6C3_AMPAM|nr:hypothetical protein FJT64_003116 [Amphibalanus amphitrite]
MSQKEVARYFRVGRSTICSIIPEVCNAIWEELAPTEMPFPDTQRWRDIAAEFEDRWNFPNCLGHQSRALHLTVSSDGSTVTSAAETIRPRKCC